MKFLADLSKISFSQEELAVIGQEMEEMLGFINSSMEGILGVINSGRDPNPHLQLTPQRKPGLYRELREDVAAPSCPAQVLLANAAIKKDGFFSVPKVVD